jgi:hypothetical protein
MKSLLWILRTSWPRSSIRENYLLVTAVDSTGSPGHQAPDPRQSTFQVFLGRLAKQRISRLPDRNATFTSSALIDYSLVRR